MGGETTEGFGGLRAFAFDPGETEFRLDAIQSLCVAPESTALGFSEYIGTSLNHATFRSACETPPEA